MRNIFVGLKLFFFLPIVVSYLLINMLYRVFVKDSVKRREFHSRSVTQYCRFANWYLNMKVTGLNLPPKEKNFLLVGNHLGFLDILCLSSLRNCLFVTSLDMRANSLLGPLTEMGGCLYVDRKNRSNIHNEIQEIRTFLKEGFCIVLFPEATSTNGEQVLPFKKSLMTSVAGTGVPIMPFVMNYRKVNGEPVSIKNRDVVCWYGGMGFLESFWRIMSAQSIEAEVKYLQEVHVESEEQRREIAATVEALVRENYSPIRE
jgi:1-acyl-sn-glycerol-3-phosphate acyltransferase